MGSNSGFTQLDQLYAVCRVAGIDGTSDGTTDPNSYRGGRVAQTVRNAPGDYTITLNPGLDAAEADVTPKLYSGGPGFTIRFNQTNDTTFAVFTADGADAPVDADFGLSIRKVRSAQ